MLNDQTGTGDGPQVLAEAVSIDGLGALIGYAVGDWPGAIIGFLLARLIARRVVGQSATGQLLEQLGSSQGTQGQ